MDYEELEVIVTSNSNNKIKEVEEFLVSSCESGDWTLDYSESEHKNEITTFFYENIGQFSLIDSDGRTITVEFYPNIQELSCY